MNKLSKNQKILIFTLISILVFYFIITSKWNRSKIAQKLMEADIKVTKNPDEISEELKKQVTEWYLNGQNVSDLHFGNLLKGKNVNSLGFFELLRLTFKRL